MEKNKFRDYESPTIKIQTMTGGLICVSGPVESPNGDVSIQNQTGGDEIIFDVWDND